VGDGAGDDELEANEEVGDGVGEFEALGGCARARGTRGATRRKAAVSASAARRGAQARERFMRLYDGPPLTVRCGGQERWAVSRAIHWTKSRREPTEYYVGFHQRWRKCQRFVDVCYRE
jgi:hypothetical protein